MMRLSSNFGTEGRGLRGGAFVYYGGKRIRPTPLFRWGYLVTDGSDAASSPGLQNRETVSPSPSCTSFPRSQDAGKRAGLAPAQARPHRHLCASVARCSAH